MLLDAGAKTSIQEKENGDTPLHFAARRHNSDLVMLLAPLSDLSLVGTSYDAVITSAQYQHRISTESAQNQRIISVSLPYHQRIITASSVHHHRIISPSTANHERINSV